MTKNTTYIFLVALILGFSFSVYTKYVKNYIPGVGKTEFSSDHSVISKKLTLSQAIAFLEHFEKIKESAGITNQTGDENSKAIKILKTINILSIAGMALFFSLFIWLFFRLRKSKRQALLLGSE